MSSTARKVLSVLGVTAAIAAGVSLGGGTAMAAPPVCQASLRPGWGCLAVENNTTSRNKMRSLRTGSSGTCIPDLAGNKRYAAYYAIPGNNAGPRPTGWIFYGGSNCDGGTVIGGVGPRGWSGVDENKYVTVTIASS